MTILFAGSIIDPTIERDPLAFSAAGQNYQLGLIEGLEQNSVQVIVCSLRPAAAWPRSRNRVHRGEKFSLKGSKIRGHYIAFVNIPIVKQASVFLAFLHSMLSAIRKTRQGPEQVQYILLYNMFPPIALAAYAVAKVTGVPVIGIVADIPRYYLNKTHHDGPLSRLMEATELHLIRSSRLIITLSAHVARDLAPNAHSLIVDGGVRTRVLPTCTAAKLPWKDGNDAFIVGYVGRLDDVNGADLLLETARTYANDGKVQFLVMGDGPYRPSFHDLAEQNKVVKYLGLVSPEEATTIETKCSLLLNLRSPLLQVSRYTFPSKLLEFMSTGTPVVSSRFASLPNDLAAHVLLLKKYSIQGIKAAIDEALSADPSVLRKLGTDARAYVLRTRNWNKQAKRVVNMLEQL